MTGSVPISMNVNTMQALNHEGAVALVGDAHANALLAFCHEALRQNCPRIFVAVVGDQLVGTTPGCGWREVR